jgi:hypothetical protein
MSGPAAFHSTPLLPRPTAKVGLGAQPADLSPGEQRPARDLWRAVTLIALVAVVLGIVGIEALWHYFPACSWN